MNLLLGLFGIILSQYASCKRLVNNVYAEEIPVAPVAPAAIPETMEEILETPEFVKKRASHSHTEAEDTALWMEALSEYNNALKQSPQKRESDNSILYPGFSISVKTVNTFSSGIPEAKLETKRQVAVKKTEKVKPKTKSEKSAQHKHSNKMARSMVNDPTPPPPTCPQGSITPAGNTSDGGPLLVSDRVLTKMEMTQEQAYSPCGKPGPSGRVCFGVPSGCVEERVCRLIVSFGTDVQRPGFFSVILAGEATDSGYIAFAFSHDRFIGNDLVIYCINALGLQTPAVALYQSFTKGHDSVTQKSKTYFSQNFCPGFGHQQRNMMGCAFDTAFKVYQDDGSYTDVKNTPFYLMLSLGRFVENLPTNDPHYGGLQSQHLMQFSRDAVVLGSAMQNPQTIYPESQTLIHLHAISAIIAFIFLIPSAIFCAKYGREAQGYPSHIRGRCRMPAWLRNHLWTAVASILLIVISWITIMVELEYSWKSTLPMALVHSISGSVAYTLTVVNALCGVFFGLPQYKHSSAGRANNEPRNSSSDVACTNWVHWVLGNAAYFCAVASICVSTSLPRAQAPCFVEYFAYLHVAILFCSHLIMAFDTKQLAKSFDDETHFLQRVVLGPMIAWRKQDIYLSKDQLTLEYHELEIWKRRRRVILFVSLVSFICAFTISVLLLLPVVLCR